MAQSGSTLSVAVETKLDRLLEMMEEVNAMMAKWSSPPPSSPASSVSSAPTTTATVATQPSTPSRTASPTSTAITMLEAIDAPAEPSAAPTSRSTTLLPVARSATTTTLDAIGECAVKWSLDSKHVTVISAAHPQATIPSTASSTVRHGLSTPTTPTPQLAASTPIPKSNSPGAEDNLAVAPLTRCSTDGFHRDTNMPGSSITTIFTMRPSSATHMLNKHVSASAVGKFQYAHQVLKVTSTNSYPFSVNDGKCYDLVLLWPPSVKYWIYFAASCVFDRGKSRERHLTIIGNTYWPSLEASTLFSLLGVHSLALLIELKPWPNWNRPLGSLIVALICPHLSIVIWVQFSCSVHKILLCPLHCESWWGYCARSCLQLLESARQVDSIKMEAIGLNQLHITVYCLLFTYYHQPVEWKPPWISLVYNTIQWSCSFAPSTIMWVPAWIRLFWWPVVIICVLLYKKFVRNAVDQCIYFRFVENYLVHILTSIMSLKLFSFSQYVSQLLYSSHCYHQLVHWKSPWLSLVYFISNILYIAYSLGIRTPTVPQLFWWPVFAKLTFWDVQYKKFFGGDHGSVLVCQISVHIEEQKALSELWLFAPVCSTKFISLATVSILLMHVTASGLLQMSQKLIQALSCEVDPFRVFEFTISQRIVLCARNMHHVSRRFYCLMSCHLLEGISCYITLYQTLNFVCPIIRDGQMAFALSPKNNPIQLEQGELFCTMGPIEKKHQWLNHNAFLAHQFSLNGHLILVEYIMGPIVLSQIQQLSWEVFLRKILVLKSAITKFTVPICSPSRLIFQCSYTRGLLLVRTVNIEQLLSIVGHLFYSGALLPLATSILLAWCDNEELDHDSFILLSSLATISVGLQLHLMTLGLTDFHGNASDQSYFLGAWEAIHYSECFASTFVLPMVSVIQLHAYPSQNSKAMGVMYKTLTSSSMLALEFYNLMVEDP